MGRRPAALLASVAALAAAFVAGWLAGRAPRSGTEPSPLDPATTPIAAGPERLHAARPREQEALALRAAPRPADAPATGSPVPVAPLADAPAAGSVVLDGLEPAGIRVVVRTAEGAPVAGADVLAALPGTTDVLHAGVSRAETGPDGRATVAVPRPGPYLLVARQGVFGAAVEDVHAALHEGGEVVVSLPRAAVVEVAIDGAPEGAPWTTTVRYPPLTDRAGRTLLDMGQLEQRSAGPTVRVTASAGTTLRVIASPSWQDERWRGLKKIGSELQEVVVPGTCRFRYAPGSSAPPMSGKRVAFELSVVADGGPLPATGRLTYAFRPEIDGHPARGWDERVVDWDPTRPLEPLHGSVPDWPPAAGGSLAWQIGRVTGKFPVPDVDRDEGVLLRATVAVSVADIESGPSGVEVVGPDGVPVPVGRCDRVPTELFAQNGSFGCSNDEGESLRRWLCDKAGAPVTAIRGAWWVSPAESAATGEPLRLRLQLGGYVLLHLRRPPSPSLGELRVERVDGAWLGQYAPDEPLPSPTDDREASVSEVLPVSNGTLLGPLLPGNVELRFRLGGIEVGRANARVVAGEVSVLTIR